MSLGPIMLDLRDKELAPDEAELLKHPLVGGVILFSRNYESPLQITELTSTIHELREPRLLVSVDHEGGKVQRFRSGFSRLPACRIIGEQYDKDNTLGLDLARQTGWLMAVELLAVGVDFSFSPVLDLDKGICSVIGDRSFHREPEVVAALSKQYIRGMKKAGMMAVGKHFPGHGSVVEDSHHAIPVDNRRYADIQMDDMIAFERLIHAGIASLMPAHVIYSAIDNKPAGFSGRWLQDILRKQLDFQGVIFSDDISMAGAEVMGNYTERARAALAAGCDMVLICNNQVAAIEVLENLDRSLNPASQVRLMRMHGKNKITHTELVKEPEWQRISNKITKLDCNPELGLGDDEI